MEESAARSDLVRRLAGGDPRALARAISLAEESAPAAPVLLREAFPLSGGATIVGVTGAPGAGKSSLVDRLVGRLRAAGRRVGVIAVDPSSAYSGGAILGDRVRMQDHANDPGVFIRSMATRGHLGGLSRTAGDAIDLMDAAGFDPILVETVGVGQDEVEIARAADVVAVVLVPGMGDDIQAIKAGILEIADVFVINKADRPDADRLDTELRTMMSLAPDDGRPRPPIFRTIAVRDEGIDDLLAGFLRFVEGQGPARRAVRRRERAEARFRAILYERLVGGVLARVLPGESFRAAVDEIAERRTDPYTAVERILSRVEVR
ncbi:MAG: methylmalonyl Co-A mutase-associated GTPase MeaB [Acidobacteriia bacterium]|nr:methylmalonyl Co-A mutase-associated GTPase MeaB [Terriglobia bacterium]